ncbi:segregation and condensation protein A [Actinomycetota bacterium]|nr:segregation and condensation protein A [Actinomycetota bacterium]
MSYNVKTADFEGPFQLLLHLVSQRKVDIGSISIATVADQYLAYIETLRELDMDVASDFIEVAATLLAIKASSLLPQQIEFDYDDEYEDLPPDQARELLIARLIAYKQFKNVASALGTRMETEGRMHIRQSGIETQFLSVLPDYLDGITLDDLGDICAKLAARREMFLLEAEHIAAKPVPVETKIEQLTERLSKKGSLSFDDLLEGNRDSVTIVVTFLAILELFHRGMIDLEQAEQNGQIDLKWRDPEQWAPAVATETADPVDDYLSSKNQEIE